MEHFFEVPGSVREELEKMREMTERFLAGSVTPLEYRSFRVPQGVYEQREEGTFMLRVRLPAGGLLAGQMKRLSAVAQEHGNGVLHVTTRQDIQVHRVAAAQIYPALLQLYEVGLSTKGGGGNTVRNITGCYDTGVCNLEAFDIAPYVVALTEFMLPDPLSFQLPRKYKLAFSGCSKDCSGATINDVGFIAQQREGKPGFAVYAAGGMGAVSRPGIPLEDFVPADEVHTVAEAIKRLFDKHGNRKNKNKARLRFLLAQVGPQKFKSLYQAELEELSKLPRLQPREIVPQQREVHFDNGPMHPEFEVWRESNVTPQKQDGYYLVHLPLLLGDIEAGTLGKLADAVERYGEGMVRATHSQNFVIRWVHETELSRLHRELSKLGLAASIPPIIRNTIACAGAATCKLGICLSRGLACAIFEDLSRQDLHLPSFGDFKIHISGCPNSCGRHPVGDIGFSGAARRKGSRIVPHYVVQLGGRVGEGKTRLAEGNDSVPARKIPEFTSRFLRQFQDSTHFPDYEQFLQSGGRQVAQELARSLMSVPSFEEDSRYYYDWSAQVPFSLSDRGAGECGAGVFDLIEVDLASSREALAKGEPLPATVLAARALLVTQGQEARSDGDALSLFSTFFLDTRLIKASFRALIEQAQASLSSEHAHSFDPNPETVGTFVDAVQSLYDNMDASLRFKPVDVDAEEALPAAEAVVADRDVDFRGVACPLNYVKTKLALDRMRPAQVLSVLLDRAGAQNVPASAEKDGHKVLSIRQEGEAWRIVIRRG